MACTKDPQDIRKKAVECVSSGDYKGAETNYRWLLKQKPNDGVIQANLAFVLTSQDKHTEAIIFYQKLINEGEGTYDLFAYFAKSLKAVGREDEAITWNYRALSIVPKLVDVRGDLAKLLVKKGRPYEALSLLASFDDHLEARGEDPYFKAQRIAIATALTASQESATIVVKAAKIDGHHYSVVMGKNGENRPFMVDTGASHTTMSRQVLETLGFSVPKEIKRVILQTADNRRIDGQQFVLAKLQVGPYSLINVHVVVCETCASLLGQTTLERFDLTTSKVDGVEFLTMKLRSNNNLRSMRGKARLLVK